MKGKQQQRREVIVQILRGYGSLDRVDTVCLASRFRVDVGTITEDVRCASEALKRETLAEQRAAREAQERVAELALARRILKSGGA
jgi:hypothetical protein